MEQNYRFSIIVFATDEKKLKKTYQSITKQENAGGEIQILPILLNENLKECALVKEMRSKKNIALIEAWEETDIRAELEKQVTGAYVAFQKQGVVYEENGLKRVDAQAKKSGAEVLVCYVKNAERINQPLVEHNLYCKEYQPGNSLDDQYLLPHTVYMGYFIKREALRFQNHFEPQIWYLEVLKVICDTALQAETISCVKKPCVGTATGQETNEEWYFGMDQEKGRLEFYEKLFDPIVEICRKDTIKHKKNAEYVLTYYVAVLMDKVRLRKWKLEEEQEEKLAEIMRGITFADVIVKNRYISQLNKGYLVQKYQKEVTAETSEEARFVLAPEFIRIEVMFFEKKENRVHVEFFVKMPQGMEAKLYCGLEENPVECEKIGMFEQMNWGTVPTGTTQIYGADIKMSGKEGKIQWWIEAEGRKVVLKNVTFRGYTPFSVDVALYKVLDGSLCYLNKQNNAVILKKDNGMLRGSRAVVRSISFCRTGKPGVKAIAARMLFEKRKREQKKKIWLCSDRTNRADDNGEVMFTYLCEHAEDEIEPYFVIDKDTADWERMGKIGKVVEPFSKEHKILFLLNEFSLSSQANKAVINPFGKLEYYYRDLMYDKKLVFLQHGITKDNQSKWLNKYNRNLFGFVVTTKPEYDSVFEYDYFYTPERVWLTGMPRYDRLYHNEKKYVTIMPTWRKTLSAGTDASGVWLLGKEFADSAYFKFYNELLNDERLLSAAKQYGYQICFMPHPNTVSGLHYFKHHPDVQFLDTAYSYRDIFAETDLMVTDYSSVAFDFAYLRKPIVYSHFDKKEFFSGGHSYTEGYFDYERDGFGEVEETKEQVVDRIIEYMASGCQMKAEYLERIEKTFAFNDKNCSQRVYEMIKKYRGA